MARTEQQRHHILEHQERQQTQVRQSRCSKRPKYSPEKGSGEDNLPLNPHQHAGQQLSSSRGGGGASMSSGAQRATGKKLSLAHRDTSSPSSSFLRSVSCSSPLLPLSLETTHHGSNWQPPRTTPRNSSPSVRSFSKNLTSSLWMMGNLCLVAALAQRPAKGSKQWEQSSGEGKPGPQKPKRRGKESSR